MKELIQSNRPTEGINLAVLKTGVKDVINFRMSLPAGSRFSPHSRPLPALAAAMLDQGTSAHSKDEIADLLESSAISLDMHMDSTRLNIKAALPKEKMNLFATLIGEMLKSPSLDQNQIDLLKTRSIAELLQAKQETSVQGIKHLSRAIFPANHPMYQNPEDKDIDILKLLERSQALKFHNDYYGLGGMNIAIAGDASLDEWAELIKKNFSGWRERKSQIVPVKIVDKAKNMIAGNKHRNKHEHVQIPDKASTDVYMGQALDLDVHSRDYFALKLANHILGGDFVSRLMDEIRVKRGLTYGMSASMSGIGEGDTGLFYIWGTFAPNLLAKGISETRKVLEKWVAKGVSKSELERAKQAMSGNWRVSLANSSGVAAALISILELGRPISFIEEYPKILQSLTLSEVNLSIKKYIDPAKFITVSAGSIPGGETAGRGNLVV